MFMTTEAQLKRARRLSHSTEYVTCIAASTAIISTQVVICLMGVNNDSDHYRVLSCIMGIMERDVPWIHVAV